MGVTKGDRLHIGFFGKRNAGKSTIVNKIIGQNLSIISSKKGTTTDVNQKSMELLPIGPVVLMDTAGFDDTEDEIGKLRVEKSLNALLRSDVIVFVSDGENLSVEEKDFVLKNSKSGIFVSIINKTDIKKINENDFNFLSKHSSFVLETSNKDVNFTDNFKNSLIKFLPDDYINKKIIASDIVSPKETVVLVIPVDKEAPKGRIILPQVNTIREMLDQNSITVVTTEKTLKDALCNLITPPKLVIVDSQVFGEVSKIVPNNIMLTSFSILFARLKGDINSFVQGAKKIDDLKNKDKILILESCSHHPVEDDIGTVKIPNLLRQYTKKELEFENYHGNDFPPIDKYSLIVHCGGCMTNRREILNRILIANNKKIPITNYGILIAKCTGILDRALEAVYKIN